MIDFAKKYSLLINKAGNSGGSIRLYFERFDVDGESLERSVTILSNCNKCEKCMKFTGEQSEEDIRNNQYCAECWES